MDRRALLKLLAASALIRIMVKPASSADACETVAPPDEAFLDDLQRRGCLYFVEQASPHTGQVLDRARWVNSTGALDPRRMASIAATGFGLTALCIADKRGYQPARADHRTGPPHPALPLRHAAQRSTASSPTSTTSRPASPGATARSPPSTPPFCSAASSPRAPTSTDAEIVRLATTIYERVDWPWMLNGGQTFSMGWRERRIPRSRAGITTAS